MLVSLLMLVATSLLSSTHAVPAAYLLCTDARISNDVTSYYLQPLDSSTAHPITKAPVIDYDNNTSIHIFNTAGKSDPKGFHAIFVENDRNNMPLINTLTNPETDFFALDMKRYAVKLNGTVETPLAYNSDLFAYVESLDLYWRFDVSDSLNNDGSWIEVLSLFDNPFETTTPAFITQWRITDQQENEAQDITSNSDDRLLYLSITNFIEDQSTSGQLITYDISSSNIVSNANCSAPMLLKYSQSRKTLFGATLAISGGVQITSIVEVDPSTCKTRVLIAGSALPQIRGAGLVEAFNDETGEWHFVWQNTPAGSGGSVFFSVNIATKKATSSVGLKYDADNVSLTGIVSQYDSSNRHNDHVKTDSLAQV